MIPVSVILPTYNRLDRLRAVICALEAQDYPTIAFEVIVISDGSTDGTAEYLQELRTTLQLQVITQGNQGAAAARNCGLQTAQGELILFLDDDVVPTSTLIMEHVTTHAREDGDCVVLGPMLTPGAYRMSAWVQWEQAMLTKQYDEMLSGAWQPTARQFYTGNASVARRHLFQAGGFDTSFRRAEDVELAYRLADLGLCFIFNPNAVGYHYAERTFQSWLATPYEYGHNDVTFAQQRGQSWLLETAAAEFHRRHHFIRLLTRLCLSRSVVNQFVLQGLRLVATITAHGRFGQAAHYAYSGIFNLRYYQGMADALGGRQPLLTLFYR